MIANRLKNKYPHLLEEWDYDKNKNIDVDINTVSYTSHKRVNWICLSKKHQFETTITSRTDKKENGKLSGCKQCFHDTLRIHDEAELKAHKMNHVSDTTSVQIGDATEKYVEELLNSMNCYKKVTNIGNIAATSDISVTDENDVTYYVQVKTLSHREKDIYTASDLNQYPDNMLIIMINSKRDRFALEFSKNISVNKLSLTFSYEKSKYKDIMYTDIDKFKQKLKQSVMLSSQKLEFSNVYNKLEYEMLQRFEIFCIKNNIKYLRNLTNCEASDGTINEYKFQAKHVSLSRRNYYQIPTNKSGGELNGKRIAKPYEVNDFDYIIIEVGGIINDELKYHNNFCIIPKSILIEQKIFGSDTCKGKTTIGICPPDYESNHWSKFYWNNIPKELMANVSDNF